MESRGRARMLGRSVAVRTASPITERGNSPLAGIWVHCRHAFVREVFVSPASSTRSKPQELNEPVIQRLLERGRSQGFLESEDVRQAFEEADIPMSHAAAFLRNLSKEGVTVVVTAADSAAPKRSRGPAKRRTAAPRQEPRAAAAAKEQQPETVTAVVGTAEAEPAAKKPAPPRRPRRPPRRRRRPRSAPKKAKPDSAGRPRPSPSPPARSPTTRTSSSTLTSSWSTSRTLDVDGSRRSSRRATPRPRATPTRRPRTSPRPRRRPRGGRREERGRGPHPLRRRR